MKKIKISTRKPTLKQIDSKINELLFNLSVDLSSLKSLIELKKKYV